MRRQRALLPNIQILRGLAALMVAVSHLAAALVHAEIPNPLPDLSFGNFGVDLFFVVSGFIMFHTAGLAERGSYAAITFLIRRLTRIVPIYWIFTTCTLLVVIYKNGQASINSFQKWHTFASYLFIPFREIEGQDGIFPIYPVGWTLQYEMFYYVWFAAAIFLAPRFRLAIISVGLVSLVMTGLLVHLPLPLSYWADPIILEFVFGMLIAWAFRHAVRIPPWLAVALTVTAVAGIFYTFYTVDSDELRVLGWGLPAAFLVAVAALALRFDGNVFTRALEGVGDASYSLYVIHPLFYECMIDLVRGGQLTATHVKLMLPMMLIGAVVVSLAFYRLVERPMTRALQKLILGQASVVPAALPSSGGSTMRSV